MMDDARLGRRGRSPGAYVDEDDTITEASPRRTATFHCIEDSLEREQWSHIGEEEVVTRTVILSWFSPLISYIVKPTWTRSRALPG